MQDARAFKRCRQGKRDMGLLTKAPRVASGPEPFHLSGQDARYAAPDNGVKSKT